MDRTEAGEATSTLVARLLEMDRVGTRALVQRLVERWDPSVVVDRVVTPALEEIGAAWDRGEVALAQVYMSARICESLAGELYPARHLARPARPRIGTATLVDNHALGRRVVTLALRSAGWAVHDLGRLEPAPLAARVTEEGIDVLFVSVLMLPSALRVRELVDAISSSGAGTKVYVGGAPFRFDGDLWREVGADGMGRSASEALALASRVANGFGEESSS